MWQPELLMAEVAEMSVHSRLPHLQTPLTLKTVQVLMEKTHAEVDLPSGSTVRSYTKLLPLFT